jgi:hypothetical protein
VVPATATLDREPGPLLPSAVIALTFTERDYPMDL